MQFIPFSGLSDKIKFSVMKFAARYEPFCVQLTSALRRSAGNVFIIFNGGIKTSGIYGIIALNNTVLHCLPFAVEGVHTGIQDCFIKSFSEFVRQEFPLFFRREKLSLCINGTSAGTALIAQSFALLNIMPVQTNEYNLMKLDTADFMRIKPVPLENGEQLVRCRNDITQEYLEKLLALQKNYEIEEVLPKNCSFDEDSCRLRLKNALRTQYILALDDGTGSFAAKAGTNSIGFKCVQIGGVYTKPSARKKGYGFNTMCALLRKICRMRKQPVLFVKKQNTAACSLYRKLKFKKISDYSIVYY